MTEITTEVKVAIATVILTLFAVLGWFAYHEYEAVKADTATIAQLNQKLADDDNTIKTMKSSQVVTNGTTTGAVVADQNAQQTTNAIDSWINNQTGLITGTSGCSADQVLNPPTVVPATPATSTTPSTPPQVVTKVITTGITSDNAGSVIPTGQQAQVNDVSLTGSWLKYCQAVGGKDPTCATLPKVQ